MMIFDTRKPDDVVVLFAHTESGDWPHIKVLGIGTQPDLEDPKNWAKEAVLNAYEMTDTISAMHEKADKALVGLFEVEEAYLNETHLYLRRGDAASDLLSELIGKECQSYNLGVQKKRRQEEPDLDPIDYRPSGSGRWISPVGDSLRDAPPLSKEDIKNSDMEAPEKERRKKNWRDVNKAIALLIANMKKVVSRQNDAEKRLADLEIDLARLHLGTSKRVYPGFEPHQLDDDQGP